MENRGICMQYLKKNCVPLGAPLHTSKLVFQSRQGASRGLFGCHDRQFCTLGTQHQSQKYQMLSLQVSSPGGLEQWSCQKLVAVRRVTNLAVFLIDLVDFNSVYLEKIDLAASLKSRGFLVRTGRFLAVLLTVFW